MEMKKLSWITDHIPASPIRELVPFAEKAKLNGVKIYHLNIGEPDIETPDVMLDALRSWSYKSVPYANSQGERVLLQSLLKYYKKLGFGNIGIDNLQITMGGSEGILWSLIATCEPGDEVITFEPFYTNYISYIMRSRARLVPIRTRIEDNFHVPRKSIIERTITKKTKAILLCNPSNPTGTVFAQDEVDMLMQIAIKHGLYVISDEVYREFVYNGTKPYSVLNYLEKYPEGVILVDSLSKRYSLCGARLGVLLSQNKKLMQIFLRFAQARLSAGFIDQHVAAQLDRVDDSYFKGVIEEYDKRRTVLVNGLRKIPGVVCSQPEGAFYVIVKLPVKNASHFAKWLLTDFHEHKETVMVAPATGFYATKGLGKDEVRIAYVLNVGALERSVEILSKALKEYVLLSS